MPEDGGRTRLDAIIRRAGEFAEKFRHEEMLLVGEAAKRNALSSASLEVQILEAAKRLYHDACLSVITDIGDEKESLQRALETLEPLFYRKPGNKAFGPRFDPGFPAALARIRTNILGDLAHGLIVMSKNDHSTKTTINQHGPNPVAVATGSHSHVQVNVSNRITELIPAAMAEARGYAIPDEERHCIIDHIQTIEDEAKKTLPDNGRLKRIASRIASEVGAAKDAAVTAGGASFGTSAVDALLKAIGLQ